CGQLRRKGAHIAANAFQGGVEQFEFGLNVSNGFVRDDFEVGWRQHDHRRAYGGAGRTRHTDEPGFLDTLALTAQPSNRTGGLSVSNNTRELRAHRHEE